MAIQGLTPTSFMNMQLNAGALFKEVNIDSIKTADDLKSYVIQSIKAGTKCLGATTGGGTFQVTPQVRQIEADGMRAPIIGSTVIDSWEVMLSTTLKEITPANLKLAIATGEVKKEGTLSRIKVRNNLLLGDHIENLAWIGDTLGGGLVVIKLENALNTTGANFTFTDKGEGTLDVEFRGHQSDLENMEYAPCEILIYEPTKMSGLTGIVENGILKEIA